MPIDCVWFDAPPPGPWQPGWCFPLGRRLSENFLAGVNAGTIVRPPISVCIPSRIDDYVFTFCIDSSPTSDAAGSWAVVVAGELIEGQKPDITVTPSINAEGHYHGYLTDGVLTDDLG